MHSLLNLIKFNKECICWCMNFIDTKMHSTTIKKKIISEVLHVDMDHCVMPHVMDVWIFSNAVFMIVCRE